MSRLHPQRGKRAADMTRPIMPIFSGAADGGGVLVAAACATPGGAAANATIASAAVSKLRTAAFT